MLSYALQVEVDESIHKGSKAYDTAKNNLLRSSFFTDPSAPKLIKLKVCLGALGML